ncbi:MAG: Fic family protein [Bacteriovoracaceae bacterium]|nr:Fic family protein [Bacteriovoracaceae bacterium]
MRNTLIHLVVAALLFQSCSVAGLKGKRSLASEDATCKDLITEILEVKFFLTKKRFTDTLNENYSGDKAKIIGKNLDALLFIDYAHAFNVLSDIHLGDSRLFSESIFDLYSGSGGKKVFKNYMNATKYLFENSPEINSSTLKEVHKRMMSGAIDGIPLERIGVFRKDNIIGNVPSGYEINEKQFQSLVGNPYIVTSDLLKGPKGYTGQIGYPNAFTTTPEVLEMIKRSNRNLHGDLVKFQADQGGNFEDLTGRLVNQLTEDLLDWFVKQRDQIGDIKSVKSFRKFAKLVAEFQRSLISIHPFYDGNGRTIRQFSLYYPFWLEGLPPPRMADVNNDIYTGLDEWTNQIIQGVHSSNALYTQLTKRILQGLRLGAAPELLYPKIPRKYGRTFRSQKPSKTIKNYAQVDVKTGQFAEFVNTKLLNDDDLMEEFKSRPNDVLDDLVKKYVEFAQESNMHYKHAKFGDEIIGLELVDQDFIETFANRSYLDPDKWKYKMARWYKDQTLWRGLSRTEEVEEGEIVSMFSSLHYQFVSNRTMRFTNDSEKLFDELVVDWSNYNNDVVNGGIVPMAKDHSESGELYPVSYGFSLSEKWEVGRAFSMGAMVVAPYGSHWDYQHLLKSRVLVGVKQSNKDVELSRLKQLRPEFSYKYPRQVEVMGIGASDPDSVMVVQLIDAEGDAYLSYVRNPKKPSEILVFEGDVRDEKKLPNNPLKKISLE